MATLTVISAIVPIVMAAWLHKLRRVITPTVSGAAFMMLAVAAMPIAVGEIEHVQGGHSGVEGLGMAGATLAVAALLSLRASGIWRLAALPVAVAAGLIVAALTGNFDVRQIIDAPWFAPPQFSGWPGFSPILLRQHTTPPCSLSGCQRHRRAQDGERRHCHSTAPPAARRRRPTSGVCRAR